MRLERLTDEELKALLAVLSSRYGSYSGGTELLKEALLEAHSRHWLVVYYDYCYQEHILGAV